MKKLRIIVLITCLLLLSSLLMAAAGATNLAESGQRVYDRAGLLTQTQIADIETAIQLASANMAMDIVILTESSIESGDSFNYAGDFYEYNGFGADDKQSGLIYFIDMGKREVFLVYFGEAIYYFNDERREDVFDAAYVYLAEGDWYGSIQAVISRSEYWVAKGKPEDGYLYDGESGALLDDEGNAIPKRSLSLWEALIALFVGAVVMFTRYNAVARQYKMKESLYRFNLQTNAVSNLLDSHDNFKHETTRRVRVHHHSGGGGFGGGSHGGGSGSPVFRGSSGSMRSGGGRKF